MKVSCPQILVAALALSLGNLAQEIDDCTISFVESIPEGLEYPAGSPMNTATYLSWLDLMKRAQKSIDIASFYWTLREEDVPSGVVLRPMVNRWLRVRDHV